MGMSLSKGKLYRKSILFTVLFIIYITDSLIFATSNIQLFIFARRVVPVVLAIVIFVLNAKPVSSFGAFCLFEY